MTSLIAACAVALFVAAPDSAQTQPALHWDNVEVAPVNGSRDVAIF